MTFFPSVVKHLSTRAYQQGIRYDLGPFQAVLQRLGNPHLGLKNCIHIAGTNGKGSTLTFLASALHASGFTVGTYTSPHFISYTERMSFNFKAMSEDDFCRYFKLVCEADPQCSLTEFEILTAMSFLYFKEIKPDYILYETGLGGRLDATNVIQPILSIITQIGLDHQAILGKTCALIAQEKAGIIKPDVPALVLQQSPAVMAVFQKEAGKNNAPLSLVPALKRMPAGYQMSAPYQRSNLALALAALIQLGAMGPESEQGLKIAQIWGRYLKIKTGSQTLVIDAAHNPQGVRALLKGLKRDFSGIQPIFVTGIYKTKEAQKMVQLLQGYSPFCYYCDFEPGRSFSLKEIQQWAPQVKPYTKKKIPAIPHGEVVVLTGSIYFISLFKSVAIDHG